MMPFLTTQWRDLAMMNWEIAPEALAPYVPAGTELDVWHGRTFVSLVGFRFQGTRVLKVAVPWHVNFEEVNLRFYVRRYVGGQQRRGVVFIKEIVRRRYVALVARWLYNENFVAAPMSHRVETRDGKARVRYEWTIGGRTHSVEIRCASGFDEMAPGSQEEFIAQHYWGYCRQPDGGTIEYHLNHPLWRIATAREVSLDCDFAALYGRELGAVLSAPPSFSFLADGSPVELAFGRRIAAAEPLPAAHVAIRQDASVQAHGRA